MYWTKFLNADLDPHIEMEDHDKKNFAKALRKRQHHLEQWEEAEADGKELRRSQQE